MQSTEKIFYAGIGSRKTPDDVIDDMRVIGYVLAKSGLVLRSGAADGADSAFENGCDMAKGKKEIFLPWDGFNGRRADGVTFIKEPTSEAMTMAGSIHPAWDKLKQGAKKLHARNCHQILGIKLNCLVKMVICWSPGSGGTEQALKIANKNNVPIINLADSLRYNTLLNVFSDIQHMIGT